MKKTFPLGIVLFAGLSACSQPVIESQLISGRQAVEKQGVISVTYFLPRQRGMLSVTQSQVDEKAVQAAVKAAQQAQQAAAKNSKDELLKEASDVALKLLQKTKDDEKSGKCLQEAKFELLEIEPDPEQQYIAYFKHGSYVLSKDD